MIFDKLLQHIHNGYKVDFMRSLFGLDIVYTVSFISQQNMYRIDIRADNIIIRRQHFKQLADFSIACSRIYQILDLNYDIDFGLS